MGTPPIIHQSTCQNPSLTNAQWQSSPWSWHTPDVHCGWGRADWASGARPQLSLLFISPAATAMLTYHNRSTGSHLRHKSAGSQSAGHRVSPGTPSLSEDGAQSSLCAICIGPGGTWPEWTCRLLRCRAGSPAAFRLARLLQSWLAQGVTLRTVPPCSTE